MRSIVFILTIAALTLSGADKKHKAPEVELAEVSVRRGRGLIDIDARARNATAKPIRGLTLVFQFFGAERVPLTSQKATIEEESLEPGGEAAIHAQLNDPPRAVTLEIAVVDASGHDFRVAKSGPYPIE
ncbi:MAG: hypothetical protein M3Z23_11080 [Acidobacteriota bacterium]|nr:hypothetical protein [Acidobacteriota bacterium]